MKENELILADQSAIKEQEVIDERIKNELVLVKAYHDELRQYRQRTRINDISTAILDIYNKLILDAELHVKMIIATNIYFERHLSQTTIQPMHSLKNLYVGVSTEDLAANFILVDPNNSSYSKAQAYLYLGPDTSLGLQENEDGTTKTLLELAEEVMQEFEIDEIDADLNVYINIDDFFTHKKLVTQLEEEVFPTYPGRVVSMIANEHLKERAEHIVGSNHYADFNSLIDQSIVASLRESDPELYKKRIYFEPKFVSSFNDLLSETDFYLLAKQEIPNLVLSFSNNPAEEGQGYEELKELANRSAHFWLTTNNQFKFTHEIVEDFFESPSLVHVEGLVSVFGTIMSRELTFTASVIDLETEKELGTGDVTINSTNYKDVVGVRDTEILKKLVLMNTKNLRSVILYNTRDKRYWRIEKIKPKVTIFGRAEGSTEKVEGLEITDMSKISFLSDYYYKSYYQSMLPIFQKAMPNTVPFQLPPRFKLYLKRIASSSSDNIENLDTKWFTHKNSLLSKILDLLCLKLKTEYVIEVAMSPLDGLRHNEIIVELGEMR